MLSISTTKFLIAELAVADYNFHRWTSKPTEYYSVNSKPTCKPPELHTIMKKCNGTGMVLKICETKNNVWKRHILSIQNSIDNHIKTTRIKPNFASLNSIHKSWNPLNKRLPRLFFLLCYYFATNRNYSQLLYFTLFLIANYRIMYCADESAHWLHDFSLRHRYNISGCLFFWHWSIWK